MDLDHSRSDNYYYTDKVDYRDKLLMIHDILVSARSLCNKTHILMKANITGGERQNNIVRKLIEEDYIECREFNNGNGKKKLYITADKGRELIRQINAIYDDTGLLRFYQ